jgi:hypothetical protein
LRAGCGGAIHRDVALAVAVIKPVPFYSRGVYRVEVMTMAEPMASVILEQQPTASADLVKFWTLVAFDVVEANKKDTQPLVGYVGETRFTHPTTFTRA